MNEDDLLKSKHYQLRMAARALGRAELAHAYGHCSIRLSDRSFLICAPQPMGLIKPGEINTQVNVEGELPPGVLGEVRIHQFIYKYRPEINAVCRVMPKNLMTLSVLGETPKARHGIGAYFANQVPLWDDPRLLRNNDKADEMVRFMGSSPAVVMRGNGAVVVGESIEEALAFTWFLEDAARIEVAVRAMNIVEGDGLLSDEEIIDRQVKTGQVYERMWSYLTDGDPESEGYQQLLNR